MASRHRPLQPVLPRVPRVQYRPPRYDLAAGRRRDAGAPGARGFRDLYFSGGEPTLWRDGSHTHGGHRRRGQADRLLSCARLHQRAAGPRTRRPTWSGSAWTGCPAPSSSGAGPCSARSSAPCASGAHPRVAVIYVIDRNTAAGIEPFLRWVRDTAFPVIGVMFYFHTPYYGRDELFLTAEERAPIIDRLLRLHPRRPAGRSTRGPACARCSPATGRGARLRRGGRRRRRVGVLPRVGATTSARTAATRPAPS